MTDAIKQSPEEKQPAFSEIEWEKPVNKKQAGSILIVGGSPHGFAAVSNSYEYASKSGAGYVHVTMPSATRTVVEHFIKNVHFLPSTISGSFSKKGLTELKVIMQDNWVTLFAGDFGKNSETALMVEGAIVSTNAKIIISKDAVDFAATSYPLQTLNRENTVIVATLSQLQKMLSSAGVAENIRFAMSVEQFATYLSEISNNHNAFFVTVHHARVFVAYKGQISITPLGFNDGLWQTKVAAFVSVYWMQHESKPFKAITHGVYEALIDKQA